MRFLFSCLLLFFFLQSAAQAPTSKKTDKHVLTEGTQIAIIPPAGFRISNQFDGFEDNTSGASIVVLQVPGSIEELTGALTTEALAKKKQEVIERSAITVNDLNGELIQVRQFSPAHGFYFIKFTLILSLEKNKAVMINAAYPEAKGEGIEAAIRDALLTTFYDPTIALDPFTALDFTIDLTQTTFKLVSSVNSSIVLDGGANGIMIIAKSLRPIDTTDKEAVCIKILNAISSISVEAVGEVKEKKMGSSEAYQIIGDITQGEQTKKAIQTILFGQNYYYNATLITSKLTPLVLKQYDHIVSSFKRK